MVKCENCGKEMEYIMVDEFNRDGDNNFYPREYEEQETNAVVIETYLHWTGYELDEEELPETICCQHCKKFPFKYKEVQVYPIVRVVCFKNGGGYEDKTSDLLEE